eukprot:UN02913
MHSVVKRSLSACGASASGVATVVPKTFHVICNLLTEEGHYET